MRIESLCKRLIVSMLSCLGMAIPIQAQNVEYLRIPELKLTNVTLVDGVDAWARMAKKVDPHSVGLEYEVTDFTEKFSTPPKVTVNLKNVSVRKALEEICRHAGAAVSWENPVKVTRIHSKGDEPKLETWTNDEGRAIKAYLVRVEKDAVVFRMQNRKEVTFPINKLSSDSRKRIQSRDEGRRKQSITVE